ESSRKAYSPKLRRAARARRAPGLFCCPDATTIAHGSDAIFRCGSRSSAQFHCFRIVIYNEFYNLNVLPGFGALRRHARLVFSPSEAMNGRDNEAAITSQRKAEP